jgi:serine phosphatase RsbU (regulator of sigma subunit)
MILILGAALSAWMAVRVGSVVKPFRNPVAFAMNGGTLYVLEKERNTVLELEHFIPGEPMELKRSYRIEPDDSLYYYMVRRMYRGRAGIVVESHMYDRATQAFVGYRFREYRRFDQPPKTLLTVLLSDPSSYAEVLYDFDAAGNHYFANSCDGQRVFWKIQAAGNVRIANEKLPPEVEPLGKTNDALASWASLCVGPDGRLYVSSRATGRITVCSPDGRSLRNIGKIGFDDGSLLAADNLSFVSLADGEPERLTIASTGNRTWVQFDAQDKPAQTLTPLKSGYPFPDILVNTLWTDSTTGLEYSFDLANRCLVVVGKTFAAITSYHAIVIGRAAIFAALALALLLLGLFLRRWLALVQRLRFPAFAKLLALFIPLLVASALIVGVWVRNAMKEDLRTEYVRRSANLAYAILNNLNITDLESIQKPEDRESAAYERVYETVHRIVDTEHVESTPKWILHKIRDGHFYFGINIWRGAIYEPFIVPPDRPMFLRALKDKTCQWGEFIDDQGEWFSFLCPIVNSKGNAISVLELYRPTEELRRSERRAMMHAWQMTGFTVVAGVGLAFLFCYLFTRPLRELVRGTSIVSTGNFNHQITVSTRDEMGHLARAFNKMVVDLKKYTEDLARTTADKERFASELHFAREVQQGALPTYCPPFAGAENIEVVARIEPAREIGGDYYDFFLLDKDHIGVVIADVSGKGMAAGLFLMMIRTLLRDTAIRLINPGEALTHVNRMIADDNPSCMFATMFYFVFNMKTGRAAFTNAGHLPALKLSRGGVTSILGEKGCSHAMPIGATDDFVYGNGEFELAPGDRILLYTDGITEAMDMENRLFGDERFLQCVTERVDRPAREICDAIYDDVNRYQQGHEPSDDITLLLFTYRNSRPL